MEYNRHYLIAGPTASGKSSLAISIAKKTGGAIVNADALQVYREYQVLTARPTLEDLAHAPHFLYGHIGNDAGYSTGAWLREIKDLLNKLDQPLIIVGGTGLYFSALLDGLSNIPSIEPSIRKILNDRLALDGLRPLQEELRSVDPVAAARIDMQNSRRVLRALEVYQGTDKPLSQWQAETPPPLLEPADVQKLLVLPDAEDTNKRIENRFDIMLDMGAIEEVRAQLEAWDPALPANQALGAKQIAQYLRGELSLDQARALSIVASRQYAKRQRTWFRSRMKDWDIEPSTDKFLDKI